jgi:hypothetical protein
LGFLVSQKEIEVDPAKVKASQEMPKPLSEKERRGFLVKLNYIASYISAFGHMRTQPIFRLLRQNSLKKKEWTPECLEAFVKIKQYPPSSSSIGPSDTSHLYFL